MRVVHGRGEHTDDGDIVLGSLELPEGNVDSNTTLTLSLQLVKDPSVLEGTLAELGGFLLIKKSVTVQAVIISWSLPSRPWSKRICSGGVNLQPHQQISAVKNCATSVRGRNKIRADGGHKRSS
jgi:hypothetical protein